VARRNASAGDIVLATGPAPIARWTSTKSVRGQTCPNFVDSIGRTPSSLVERFDAKSTLADDPADTVAAGGGGGGAAAAAAGILAVSAISDWMNFDVIFMIRLLV
jgi:precorrin isomerase